MEYIPLSDELLPIPLATMVEQCDMTVSPTASEATLRSQWTMASTTEGRGLIGIIYGPGFLNSSFVRGAKGTNESKGSSASDADMNRLGQYNEACTHQHSHYP